ncbi:MAG: hypothetical protein K6E28_10385 [Eubacterium sp.]|nr:hypothetical protein [Eubacterium sp.]
MEDIYYIIGTAYAGKPTMVKLLAEKSKSVWIIECKVIEKIATFYDRPWNQECEFLNDNYFRVFDWNQIREKIRT